MVNKTFIKWRLIPYLSVYPNHPLATNESAASLPNIVLIFNAPKRGRGPCNNCHNVLRGDNELRHNINTSQYKWWPVKELRVFCSVIKQSSAYSERSINQTASSYMSGTARVSALLHTSRPFYLFNENRVLLFVTSVEAHSLSFLRFSASDIVWSAGWLANTCGHMRRSLIWSVAIRRL